MGKKDTEKLLRITMEFLDGLTEKQFQDLLDGKAVIRLDGEGEHVDYQQLMESLRHEVDMESALRSYTKKELMALCRHNAIEIKSRDTKKIILVKITSHVNKEQPEKDDWSQVKKDLHSSGTLDEAKRLLANHKLLRLKKDLTAFAKSLGIYVNKRYTKQELLERIVDSVVGARIRGKVIRQEE